MELDCYAEAELSSHLSLTCSPAATSVWLVSVPALPSKSAVLQHSTHPLDSGRRSD